MSLEKFEKDVHKKAEEGLREAALEKAARAKMEELAGRVASGDWDPEEFAETEVVVEETKPGKFKKGDKEKAV